MSKSTVDWAKFASVVPKDYNHEFRHLKVTNDKFVGRVNALPAEMKAIDFEKFKKAGVPKEIVDQFANQYKVVEIAYPVDLSNRKQEMDVKEKAAIESAESWQKILGDTIKINKAYIEALDKVPPLGEMTREMYMDYFPEMVVRGEDNTAEALGYEREKEEMGATDVPLHLPVQEQIRRLPQQIGSGIDWLFQRGPWANAQKLANSDLYPEDPSLEEQRIERLRLDTIGQEEGKRQMAGVWPWYFTQRELKEKGLDRETFHAAERLLAQAADEKLAELEEKERLKLEGAKDK